MPEVSKNVLPKITHYSIGEKQIEYDEYARIISVQWQENEEVIRVNIPLTPTELIIISALLEAPYQKDVDLEQKIYAQRSLPVPLSPDSYSIVKKHTNNLRPKLQKARLTILRIFGFGYILKDMDTL